MEALLESLIKIVNSPIVQEELRLLCGIETEIRKLSSLLSTTKAVLEDAEQKQFTDKATQLWLQKLNLVAYEVDDILDDYATEVSRELKSNNICCNVLDCLPATSNIWFRHRIGARMKKIIGKFDAVADERIKLGLSDQKHGSYFNASRETVSLVNEPEVFGRDKEKEQIVHTLMEEKIGDQNVSVLPIVGVGGLGKTTLAQLVFNDQRITEHFELKLWVWVSEDFDAKRIIKALIESKQGTPAEASGLDPLQRKLQELLRGKRYLVVLDDVWNDDALEWENLKFALAYGSSGSSIVTTTRMEKVAQIMGTLETRHLSSLSEDHCWSLFKQLAFDRQEKQENSNLEAIGKEIVKKCSGVPLAAKALGSFLRFKTEAEWNSVKCSELWNLPEDEKHILPALKLSYLNLPVELRSCFAYCAVFPKGSKIEKEEVIHLWMANGLISSKGMRVVEDVGDAVLTELHHRSLFQAEKKDKLGRGRTVYKMHDLVHDLAQSVVEAKHGGTELDSTVRNLTLDLQHKQLTSAFPIKRMRAFPIKRMEGTDQYSSFLSKYGSLRTFIVRSGWSAELTDLLAAVSNLKHLRHLNLSSSSIVELPNSICDLRNLEILNLNHCPRLRSLPKGMRFLKNLRHLCLEDCVDLTYMPSGIGQLTCLRTLSRVVLGGEEGFRLSELRDLNNLGGTLRIWNLERIQDREDAEAANLITKQRLGKLYLNWDSEAQYNDDEEVLEALKPCPNLQFLSISGFKGTSLSAWISTLTNLVEIALWECACTHLSVLGHLPHLQKLFVSECATEYTDDDDEEQTVHGAQEESITDDDDEEQTIHGAQEESITATATAWFPSLKELEFWDMPNLKGMLGREVGLRAQGGTSTTTSAREVFLRLQSLLFCRCPSLTSPLPRMLSLGRLTVSECPPNMAWASISNLANLKSLLIHQVEGLSCFPEEMLQNLSLLESLEISGILDLQALPSRSLASLTALKKLTITRCPELKSLPEGGLRGLASLQELYLDGCNNLVSLSMGTKALTSLTRLRFNCSDASTLPEELKHVPTLQNLDLWNFRNLTSLPNWFGDHLTSLQHLSLRNCPKLKTLPSSIQKMTTLQSLTLKWCPLLGPRCESGGAERYKIEHVPNVETNRYCQLQITWPI